MEVWRFLAGRFGFVAVFAFVILYDFVFCGPEASSWGSQRRCIYFFVCMMSTLSIWLTLTMGRKWDSNGGRLLVVIVSVVVHWVGLSADAQARLVGMTPVIQLTLLCNTLDEEALFTHYGFFTCLPRALTCLCRTQYGLLGCTRQWFLRPWPDLNNSLLCWLYIRSISLCFSRSRDWEGNLFWTKRQRREIFAIILWG